MTRFSKALLPFSALVCCFSAVAQVRFCIGGDLDHLSPTQRAACSAKMQAVRNVMASSLQTPEDWHFVVVCGEHGWTEYTAYAALSGDTVQGPDLSTNFERHETFLREGGIDSNNLALLRRAVSNDLTEITEITKPAELTKAERSQGGD